MWIGNEIVKIVDGVADIYYINGVEAQRWNENRKAKELRMFSGWCWVCKRTGEQRYGFKTISVAYRDAYYALVTKSDLPKVRHLRLVRRA